MLRLAPLDRASSRGKHSGFGLLSAPSRLKYGSAARLETVTSAGAGCRPETRSERRSVSGRAEHTCQPTAAVEWRPPSPRPTLRAPTPVQHWVQVCELGSHASLAQHDCPREVTPESREERGRLISNFEASSQAPISLRCRYGKVDHNVDSSDVNHGMRLGRTTTFPHAVDKKFRRRSTQLSSAGCQKTGGDASRL